MSADMMRSLLGPGAHEVVASSLGCDDLGRMLVVQTGAALYVGELTYISFCQYNDGSVHVGMWLEREGAKSEPRMLASDTVWIATR